MCADHSRVMCTDGGAVPKGNSGRPMSKDEFMQLNSRMDVEVSPFTLDRFACMSCRRYQTVSHLQAISCNTSCLTCIVFGAVQTPRDRIEECQMVVFR